MILTNKCNVELFYDNIMEDFDIFVVQKTSRHLEKTNILDSSLSEYKARAVQYTYGDKAFVLFEKGSVDEFQYRMTLQEEFKDVTVKKLELDDIRQFDETGKNQYFQRNNLLLVQLLVNSLRVPQIDKFSYNNISGKLLYSHPDWDGKDKKTKKINYRPMLEINFGPGMHLNLDLKTYSRFAKTKGIPYVIDPKSGMFRKRLGTDSNQLDNYSEGSMRDHHFTINYLDIGSMKNFEKSKLGIMQKFLDDVDLFLGKYLKIHLGEIQDVNAFHISSKEKNELNNSDYAKMLSKKGINIVDLIDTSDSDRLKTQLKNELEKYCGLEVTEGKVNPKKYNIRIIHDQEYYEETEEYDEHLRVFPNCIVQHMTIEGKHFKDNNKLSPAITKVLQELILKGDVENEKVSIFNWNHLNYKKDWTFVIRKKRETVDKKKGLSHKNSQGVDCWYYYDYICLTIDTEGRMQFDQFNDQDDQISREQSKILEAYEFYEKDESRYRNSVEGLVFSDINNIQAIILTTEKTMPNVNEVKKGLDSTCDNDLVEKDTVLDALQLFEELDSDHVLYCDKCRAGIEYVISDISKKELRKIINVKTTIGSNFNRFLHENYGIWVASEMKHQDFEEQFMLENILDIKYYREENYAGEEEFFYFVGTKRTNLQQSVHNACAFRKVRSMMQNPEFEELLPLLSVDFVRNNQHTVIPFPFKYLREYYCKLKIVE